MRHLTAEMADAATTYLREHVESGTRRRERAIRMDLHQLAIVSDYVQRLEAMIGEVEREHEADRGQVYNRLCQYMRTGEDLRRELVRGVTLLATRPRFAFWRWAQWHRDLDVWVTACGEVLQDVRTVRAQDVAA